MFQVKKLPNFAKVLHIIRKKLPNSSRHFSIILYGATRTIERTPDLIKTYHCTYHNRLFTFDGLVKSRKLEF